MLSENDSQSIAVLAILLFLLAFGVALVVTPSNYITLFWFLSLLFLGVSLCCLFLLIDVQIDRDKKLQYYRDYNKNRRKQ